MLIDHSNSPGISPDLIRGMGDDLPLNIGQTRFECPTYTCNHCQMVVILNPLRQRERGYCASCDRYICDVCKTARVAGAACVTFNEITEVILDKEAKHGSAEGVVETLTNRPLLKGE